ELELFRNPPYTLNMSYDCILNPMRKQRKNNNKKSLPPRPQNGWILFRRNFQSQRSQCPGRPNTLKEISKLAAESWKIQPKEVKQYFNILSKIASHKHKTMYPEYVYNPKKFRSGDSFIFRHVDKDKIVKSRNSKASLSKKTKASGLSNTNCGNASRNKSYPKNDEREFTLPSSVINIQSLVPELPDFLIQMSVFSPNSIPFFSQCQFDNDINKINANKQINYTNFEFGYYS
ncbi:2327_t:CDS:1, partial [Paraglomus occultum]